MDDEQSTKDHKARCLDVIGLFLRRLPHIKPSEILSDSEMLLRMLREDYVESVTYMDQVLARLDKLEARMPEFKE